MGRVSMSCCLAAAFAVAWSIGASTGARAVEPAALTALAAGAPAPPWPAGDERGMANTLGEATTLRCGWHLSQRGARTYEASFVRSNTMPKSPFANPSLSKPKPTAGVPFSAPRLQQRERSTPAPSRSSRARRSMRSATSRSISGAVGSQGIRSPADDAQLLRRLQAAGREAERRTRRCSSSASRRSRRSSRPRCCSTRRRCVGKGKRDGRRRAGDRRAHRGAC